MINYVRLNNPAIVSATSVNETSELEISLVENKSVLTTSLIFRPLKIFQLKKSKVCHVVLSNYGGGFVEGDRIGLEIKCGAGTRTVFSTQANTRVYKNAAQLPVIQQITGSAGEGAFTVFLGDPLVPQKDSIFEQQFEWNAGKDSVLLLADWFSAGRILNGERFSFSSYSSEFKVSFGDIPVIWDRFRLVPSEVNVNSPGAFLNHNCYLNIFLAGHENLEMVRQLETALRLAARKYFLDERPLQPDASGLLGSLVKVNEYVLLLRCSAGSHDILQNIIKDLALALEDEAMLGFNPAKRKF